VRLHFADVTGGKLPASSVMNVSVNGVWMLKAFVVPRASGGVARALFRSFVFNAPVDGKVTLVFRGGHLASPASVSGSAPVSGTVPASGSASGSGSAPVWGIGSVLRVS